jgi:hypothetical protein
MNSDTNITISDANTESFAMSFRSADFASDSAQTALCSYSLD